MNLLNKFKSLFKGNSEEKPMTHDEKIGYLANELIKELKASGRSMQCNEYDKGFGHMDFWVHDLGKERAYIEMQNSSKWSLKVKPTFKEF